MELWICRHGEAGRDPTDELGPSLTETGKKQILRVAAHLKVLDRKPQQILVSPLRRAQESAQIYGDHFGPEPITVDWLLPGTEPSKILHSLSETSFEHLALVGHLPSLGWLFSTLIWGLPPKEVSLAKGSVTSIRLKEWQPAAGKILWIYHPELGMSSDHSNN